MTRAQTTMLNQVKKTWEHHPDWTIGKLLQSAYNISTGEVRTNPAYAKHGQILSGLRALIPEGGEEQ